MEIGIAIAVLVLVAWSVAFGAVMYSVGAQADAIAGCKTVEEIRGDLNTQLGEGLKVDEFDATRYLELFDKLPPQTTTRAMRRIFVATHPDKPSVLILAENLSGCAEFIGTLKRATHDSIVEGLAVDS